MRSQLFVFKSKMDVYCADLNSRFSDDEDPCSSYFNSTKYCCLYCGIALCNKCSVFEDDEDTPGWKQERALPTVMLALTILVVKDREH